MAASRISALNRAAKIVELRQPYVLLGLGVTRARAWPPHASKSPSTSLRLCPASDSSASESPHNPNPASTATYTTFSTTPMANARV